MTRKGRWFSTPPSRRGNRCGWRSRRSCCSSARRYRLTCQEAAARSVEVQQKNRETFSDVVAFNQAAPSVPRQFPAVKPSCSYLAMRLTAGNCRGSCFLRLIKNKKSPLLLSSCWKLMTASQNRYFRTPPELRSNSGGYLRLWD